MLTDEQIAAMTAEERGTLIRRLARPVDDEPAPSRWLMRHLREMRVALMVGSVVVLVPWTAYLAVTLPRTYVAHHWDLAWVGFDVMLLLLLLTTAVLGFLRRQLVIVTAFATGVLLLCDAWFDVLTAQAPDRPVSLVTAVAVELPLSVVLMAGSLQLLRLTAARLWTLEHGAHSWQVPLPLPSAADQAVRRRAPRRRSGAAA